MKHRTCPPSRRSAKALTALLTYLTAGLIASVSSIAVAQRYSADVPDFLITPDEVTTERLGTLRFFDGMPDDASVSKVYDQLDFSRGVEAFLTGMPVASLHAMCEGLNAAGVDDQSVGITEDLMDARSLWLTPNSTTIYVTSCLDLSQGPVVINAPPGLLGFVNDAVFHWVTDIGLTGPDQGRGGRYLLLPPDYDGPVPALGFHVVRSNTYRHWFLGRAIASDGDVKAAVAAVKAEMNIYPLSEAPSPVAETFINFSGLKMNTIHARSGEFYREINTALQHEPAGAFPPEMTGLFASIGIKKGLPFTPDERMNKILEEAAVVANATARALLFRARDRDAMYFYDDRQWYTSFVGGSHEFLSDGEMMLDARTTFHFGATGITPAMSRPQVGTGSVYAFTAHDAGGAYLDGSNTYSVTLPGPVPAKDFWSFTVYSPQHLSMLETDQKLAGIDSTVPDIAANEDGSYTIWFGPEPPEGKASNWVQTMPDQGFAVLLRLYGPLEPWFDKSWKPSDFKIAP